jgi:D-aminoacyl-tRNA deacylase
VEGAAMRAVIQRVSSASVSVEGQVVGRCGKGLVVLVAAHREDSDSDAAKMADRVYGMRIFPDGDGKMNLSLKTLIDEGVEAGVLAVSNFTVYGDATQRRPSFVAAASFERGRELFDRFVDELRALGAPVATGEFGAQMEVAMVNDGPVTLIVES